jgi:hypothetical protein
MKHLNWNWIFAGLSAVAGVAYVLHEMNASQNNQGAVTNVFPPLNTGVTSAPGVSLTDPTEPITTDSDTAAQNQNKLVPYPVYSV